MLNPVSYLRTGLVAAAICLAMPALAEKVIEKNIASEQQAFRIVQLAENLHHPWAVAQLPDGRFLVTERRGRLALIDNGKTTYLEGVPEVSAKGQGGLLDVVLHPKFGDGTNDWIYLTYSKPSADGAESASAVVRAKLTEQGLVDVQPVFEQDRYSAPGRHYGSRLAWLPDGTLLMSIGDRGVVRERAQDLTDHAGSVLRMSDTGAPVAGNPFAGDKRGHDEIYSYGNRNIQGMTVTADGRIWASEHGARTGDELNLIEPGVNYGWPTVSKSFEYSGKAAIGVPSAPGVRDAVFIFDGRFAPSGLALVDSERFPAWQGNLLAGGLGSEKLVRVVLDGDKVTGTETLLEGQVGRIRDVRQGKDGYLYLLNDSNDGGLYRLEPVVE
ncbi:PQQ-dependent sugar dehydrogenase [Microbulbifer agarilyticus]|uniref:PQQ-dependent sugar dehydrogenase n=1 Tax=Microbulbifer agarilyticus TaxID=260552 RepID=UPI001CD785F7|nr:PQQ-dependent sugar dehydrogenase [Microbulbifer agarilyticus]MCA0893371.1 PQQ-dependent sugar dehydrogenase [Microbulbifer agarilyticus]